MSVTGKVILINGATRGLGFEYARSLAALGAKIVGGDVMDCDLPGALSVKLDVTDMAPGRGMTGKGHGSVSREAGIRACLTKFTRDAYGLPSKVALQAFALSVFICGSILSGAWIR